MNTITRKIEIWVNEKDKEIRDHHYKTLKHWNFILTRCANLVASHQFILENTRDLIYLEDGIKRKIADMSKDEAGILNTSRMNATYRVLSKEHLDDVPSTFLTALNSTVCKNFTAESKEYFAGTKSLRSYKRNSPMPFQKRAIRFLQWDKKLGNFTFMLTKIPFATKLGRDGSNNKVIIERVISEEYKLCDSAIMFSKQKNKWFLLLTIQFESKTSNLDPDKKCIASLSIENPIVAKIGAKELLIGSKEEFLYRRLQIQAARHRLQKACKYNDGGHTRSRKLQALDRYKAKELNYIKSRLHLYSRKLIDFAIKGDCGVIHLDNYEEVKNQTKGDDAVSKFLLRNWNYYNLRELITYKARKAGIEVL